MEDHNNIPELYRKVIYFIVEKSGRMGESD